MSCITIAQTSRRQVENTDKHRDEDIRFITLASCLVDGLHDACRVILVGRGHTEHRMYHRHHNGRGHSLATHITDTEEQLFIADEEVKQIATHLARRRQRTIDFYVFSPQTERAGQHLVLDMRRNAQFTANALLFQFRLLQLTVVPDKSCDDPAQHKETCQ